MVFCYFSPLMSLVGGSGGSTFTRTVQFQFITVLWWTLTERHTNTSFLMEHSNIGQANLYFFPSTELKGQKMGINSPPHQPVHPVIIRQITWKYSLCRHRSSFNELFSHLSISLVVVHVKQQRLKFKFQWTAPGWIIYPYVLLLICDQAKKPPNPRGNSFLQLLLVDSNAFPSQTVYVHYIQYMYKPDSTV